MAYTYISKEWVSVKERKPDCYKIVDILGDNKTIQSAWWTGQEWDYSKKKITGKIRSWRHQ